MKKESQNGKLSLAVVLLCLVVCAAATLLTACKFPVGLAAGAASRGDNSGRDFRGDTVTTQEVDTMLARNPDAQIRWDVPLSGGSYDSESTSLTLENVTLDDARMMGYFPNLTSVRVNAATNAEAIQALREALPHGEVTWQVKVGEKSWPSDTKTLTVSSREVSAEELSELLELFPELESVKINGDEYTTVEKVALREAWENISFHWPVTVLGKITTNEATQLSFAGTPLTEGDLQEIRDTVPEFDDLQLLDLRDCGLDSETLHALDVELGDVAVAFNFTIYDFTVCSTDEEIDLSGYAVEDHAAEVERKLDWMPNLQKVIMVDCQLKDEEMDELNRRHPDVRFVWLVRIKWAGIRTDNTFFIPYPESGARQYPAEVGIDALQYCPDLVALDLGHTNIKNLDFLEIMPHIRYLILADNWLTDIEKVGTLEELTWLELFKTIVTDISPLVNCKNLTDLNICYITARGNNVYETLRQMKSLKRLWICGTLMSKEQIEALREELPDCEIWAKEGDDSTGSTWRYSDSYYEMRDAFHMYYMSGEGNTVDRMTEEEMAAIHLKYWGY